MRISTGANFSIRLFILVALQHLCFWMGGPNCAVYGCHCSYSRSPGVTFFKISKLNAGDADAKSAAEWRQRLIIACAREPPFNKDKAHICSRYFTSACLMPVGGKNRLFYNRCAHMRYVPLTQWPVNCYTPAQAVKFVFATGSNAVII